MSFQKRYSSLWSVFKALWWLLRHYDVFYLSHSLSPSSLLDRSTCHSLDHTRRHSHTHTCVDSRCQSVPEHILSTKRINRMFEKLHCQFGSWKLQYIFTVMLLCIKNVCFMFYPVHMPLQSIHLNMCSARWFGHMTLHSGTSSTGGSPHHRNQKGTLGK